MDFKLVNIGNAFVYFLFMTFGEGDYLAFRNALRDDDTRPIGAKVSSSLLNSFLNALAEDKVGDSDASIDLAFQIRQKMFKNHVPQPDKLEIDGN